MGNSGCSETAPSGGERRIAAATGRGRKTIRAYIREAKKLGWSKEVPPDEALASRVAQRRQPGPTSSEASPSEKALRAHHERIQQWVRVVSIIDGTVCRVIDGPWLRFGFNGA